ncbi:MAG: glycosyltransferase, partial [Candidatus Sulfotelmatobacter sp.]
MPLVKIAIDIRRMTEFGVGTYIRNVVRTLGRLDHETTFFLIGPAVKVEEIGPLPANFHTVPLDGPERSLKNFREFRAIVQRLQCDLVHIPNLFSIPRALPCPYVMTVHDMLDHLSRGRQQTGFWGSLHFQLTQQVLRRASRIFAVSNFTKIEMEKLFGIPSAQIEVIYNAIDERFLRGHASAGDRQLIAERYQVNYPFLLYAGRISPHKNVVRMIEAFSALKAELEKDGAFPDLKLIIIGDDVSGNPDLRRTVVR